MPELPEVETIVNELKPALRGRTFEKIKISWERSVTGDARAFGKTLPGRTIKDLFRRGKYICFELDNRWHLTIHLRMSGQLVSCLDQKEKKYVRVEFSFDNGCRLYFVDKRKFGRLKLWPPGQMLLPELGTEPLEPGAVWRLLKNSKSRRAIKTVLLDQGVLAGVGNIYADEALFAAGIHPQLPALNVPGAACRRLGRELPRILKAAIENRGTTLSDYRPPQSSSGNNQHFLRVYGRENQPCLKCRTPIQRIKINNRSSYFCPHCQPLKIV